MVCDPDKWSDEVWARFDAEVGHAVEVLLTARHYRQRAIYKPSAFVAKKLSIFGRHLDAELSVLLGEEGERGDQGERDRARPNSRKPLRLSRWS